MIRRRLFNFAAAVSLLLCLAALWLWVSSQFWGWEFEWQRTHSSQSGRSDYRVRISYGEMEFMLWSYEVKFRNPEDAARHRRSWSSQKSFSWGTRKFPDDILANGRENVLGFSVTSRGDFFWLTAPCWFFVLLTGIFPIIWIVRYRFRWTARKRNGCAFCGYSLTGNTSGVCPECGTPIPKDARESTAAASGRQKT